MTESGDFLIQWLQQYHRVVEEWYAAGNILTPEIAREGLAALTRTYTTSCPDLPLIINDQVDSGRYRVPVRLYHPDEHRALPVAVFFHGGGHMAGSVDVYDPISRKIALASKRIVVAVEYRLAPEFPYPAGIDDGSDVLEGCFGMLERLGIQYQPRLALVGDSAGGAMSATLAHRYQHSQTPEIDRLVLIYPSLDYTLSSPSINRYGAGFLLEKDKIEWYFKHYFQHNENRQDVSPLFMEITNTFPETLIITAGFCPLYDEAISYRSKLEKQGITVVHVNLDKMIHAFLNLEDLTKESCDKCYRKIGAFLKPS